MDCLVKPDNDGVEPDNGGVRPGNDGVEPDNGGVRPDSDDMVLRALVATHLACLC